MWRKGKIAEFMRYCFVGGIAAAIHYAVYYILQFYMNVNLAYTIGYAVSLTVNFFLTSYVTFRAAPSLKRAFGFGGSHLLNYLNHIWLFNLFLYLGLSRAIAPIAVLAIVVPVNFVFLRWVFKRAK